MHGLYVILTVPQLQAISLKTEFLQRTRQIKDIIEEKIQEIWLGKRMYGQFPCSLDEIMVDKEQ